VWLLCNSLYIDLKCKFDEKYEKYLLNDYINKWLGDDKKDILVVLGDFGAGKTTTSQKITIDCAKEYLNDNNKPIPILIELRNYNQIKSIEKLIENELAWKDLEFKDFLTLFENNQLLLICDGFDEMSIDTRKQFLLQNLRELQKICKFKNKILITGRTHYFERKEYEKYLIEESMQGSTGLSWDKGTRGEIVFLEKFDDADIKNILNYFTKRQGNLIITN